MSGGAGMDSIVGSGSLMPESFYLQKMEQTCIYEDPDLMDNYYRQSLKDMRPDKPFFESDQTRRNVFSKDRLNLRHTGKRTEATPDLPDGTFLDHVFLETDERGIAVDPDFKKYRKQQEARGKFIKHGCDEDNSVPSSGWNPTQVTRDIRGQFYNVKNRMRIFDESMDSRHNGGTYQTKLTSTGACMQDSDERKPIMRDEMCYNRSNIVNDLSNNTSIGWRRTTDHRFKISKYGMLRNNAPLSTQDWSKNRASARIEHDILLSWRDTNVPKALTLKMIDMAKKKTTEMDAGRHVLLGESRPGQVRSSKLTPTDINIIMREVHESRSADANTLIKSSRAPRLMALPSLDTQKMDKSIIDPIVYEVMGSINRRMRPCEINDLREQIAQSAADYGLLMVQNNRTAHNVQASNDLLWASSADYARGQSMKITNYAKPSMSSCRGQAVNDTDFEKYTKSSKSYGQRRGKLQNTLYNMEAGVIEQDNEYGEEIYKNSHIGTLGSKYMRRFMDNKDIQHNELTEMSALNVRTA